MGKKLDLKDCNFLLERARHGLQIRMLHKPTNHTQNLEEYCSLVRGEIAACEEFIFQAKRYLRTAKVVK